MLYKITDRITFVLDVTWLWETIVQVPILQEIIIIKQPSFFLKDKYRTTSASTSGFSCHPMG